MNSIPNSEAVAAALGVWNPCDLAWVERLEWAGDAAGQSIVILVGLFQRRTEAQTPWPSTSAPTFRVRLAFEGVQNLRICSFGGLTQVMGFAIDDISRDAREDIKYRVWDYEDGKLEFECAVVRVESVERTRPPS
jgi:hypothetical protein